MMVTADAMLPPSRIKEARAQRNPISIGAAMNRPSWWNEPDGGKAFIRLTASRLEQSVNDRIKAQMQREHETLREKRRSKTTRRWA